MSADHLPLLRHELDRAADDGQAIRFWWRDDDAVRATPELDRLLALSGDYAAPVAIAAIPARVEPSLVARLAGEDRLASEDRLRVLPHGWSHADHAPPGEKPSEFGPHRPLAARHREVAAAREAIRDLFGPLALDLFVPPWNRIDPALVAILPETGHRGLSAFGSAPRGAAPQTGPAGLRLLPASLDPVAWRGDRSLAAPEALARMLRDALARGAPIGLLTHHLVFDAALWEFTRAVLELVSRHPAVTVASAEALLGVPAEPSRLENAA